MPDYIHHRLIRWGVDAAVLAAATAAFTDTAISEPDKEPDGVGTAPVELRDDTPRRDNPAFWPVLVGGSALLCLSIYADARITRALVGWLRSRGVTRPHTVLGVCTVPILLGVRALENTTEPRDGTMKR